MNIIGQNYLCVVKEAQVVGTLYGALIYKITDVRLIPFFVNKRLIDTSSLDERHS